MKRYLVLFAIFITAIFFYPVFAHAEKIGQYFNSNPVPAPVAFFLIGMGLLTSAFLSKRVVRN